MFYPTDSGFKLPHTGGERGAVGVSEGERVSRTVTIPALILPSGKTSRGASNPKYLDSVRSGEGERTKFRYQALRLPSPPRPYPHNMFFMLKDSQKDTLKVIPLLTAFVGGHFPFRGAH